MLLGARRGTDPRVDVYALGITLLEAVTGRHPFEDLGGGAAIQARIAHQFVRAHMPGWVQEVLLRGTHPTPEHRFQTVQDFVRGDAEPLRTVRFDGNRIKVGLPGEEKADAAIARRKWHRARRLAHMR